MIKLPYKRSKHTEIKFKIGNILAITFTKEGVKTSNLQTFNEKQMTSLHNYQTGECLRDATVTEMRDSIKAAKSDGGAGVIMVDGISCYVEGEDEDEDPIRERWKLT